MKAMGNLASWPRRKSVLCALPDRLSRARLNGPHFESSPPRKRGAGKRRSAPALARPNFDNSASLRAENLLAPPNLLVETRSKRGIDNSMNVLILEPPQSTTRHWLVRWLAGRFLTSWIRTPVRRLLVSERFSAAALGTRRAALTSFTWARCSLCPNGMRTDPIHQLEWPIRRVLRKIR
jgi:hypothetical protein